MTNKRRLMAQAMADGKTMKEAAAYAGYNLPYARKIAREPAYVQLVDRLREAAQPKPEEKSIPARAWAVINDVTASNSERVAAMRVLIAYDRAHAADKPNAGPLVIIDDIAPECENCPRKDRIFDADGKGTGAAPPGPAQIPDDA